MPPDDQLAFALPVPPPTPAELNAAAAARRLLDVGLIYHEPGIEIFPRAREILDRFPRAERREVRSHWQIPGLHGNEGSADDWVQIKRTVLILGARKSFPFRDNGRSSDFVAPGISNGCAMACAYCYVPRRKGFANPITTYVNIEAIQRAIARHASRMPRERTEPSQVDPSLWSTRSAKTAIVPPTPCSLTTCTISSPRSATCPTRRPRSPPNSSTAPCSTTSRAARPVCASRSCRRA